MGRLTTHVLDTARGKPAAGVLVELYRLEPRRERIADATTNTDGRLDEPILEGEDFRPGIYELIFHAGAYLADSGAALTDPPFLDLVPVRVALGSDAHYHVPLLLAPFGYTIYRGS